MVEHGARFDRIQGSFARIHDSLQYRVFVLEYRALFLFGHRLMLLRSRFFFLFFFFSFFLSFFLWEIRANLVTLGPQMLWDEGRSRVLLTSKSFHSDIGWQMLWDQAPSHVLLMNASCLIHERVMSHL